MKQVENQKEEVPFSYYEGLFQKLEPQSALERLPSVTFADNTFQGTLEFESRLVL